MADASAGEPIPDASAVWDALREVLDPEIGENLVDIGLVYRVDCAPGLVEVDLTMTTPACPAAGSIAEEAEHAIRSQCPGVRDVRINIVFDPPWTPERMSEQVRQRFGW